MPIVDKYVNMIITDNIKNRYKELGYNIPDRIKRKPHFRLDILVKDLSLKSRQKIRVECPICREIRKVFYYNYNRSSDICTHCFGRIQGKKNIGEKNGQYGKCGKESKQYKNGTTKIIELIRKSVQYREWRNAVYERDNYTCTKCNKNGFLNCHHIESFTVLVESLNVDTTNWRKFYKELFNIDNGITLCKECHAELHIICGGFKSIADEKSLNKYLIDA